MPQLRKSFTGIPTPLYFYITASGSQGALYEEEDLQGLLDWYEERRIDIRIYKLDQDRRFSGSVR